MCLMALHSNAQQTSRQNAQEMNRRAEQAVKKANSSASGDSLSICRAIIDAVSYSLKCDEYDRMPDAQGAVKTKYVNDNKKRLHSLTAKLFNASAFLNKTNHDEEAHRALVLYINAMENPLMKDQPDDSGMAAYRLAQLEMQKRNYRRADRYADVSLAYDNSAQLGAEIKAQCMKAQMITPQDSSKYLAVINKLYETDPNNEKYFAWIMQFYDRPQQRHKLEYFVDKQLEDNPGNIVPWILKGELAMKAKRWDEAIDAYKSADEIDPSNIPVAYNIAICINSKAAEMQQLARNNNTTLSQTDSYNIKQMLAESRTYLERVKGRDPHRQKVDWVKPLYIVYTILGEKIKAQELEPIANGFKNK